MQPVRICSHVPPQIPSRDADPRFPSVRCKRSSVSVSSLTPQSQCWKSSSSLFLFAQRSVPSVPSSDSTRPGSESPPICRVATHQYVNVLSLGSRYDSSDAPARRTSRPPARDHTVLERIVRSFPLQNPSLESVSYPPQSPAPDSSARHLAAPPFAAPTTTATVSHVNQPGDKLRSLSPSVPYRLLSPAAPAGTGSHILQCASS